jgi:hypothetical protein
MFALLIFISITAGLGFLMGKFAESKGYGFWLLVIPNVKNNSINTNDELVKKTNSGNTAGIIISVIGQLIALSQLSLVMGMK